MSQKKIILITGSRDIQDSQNIFDILDNIIVIDVVHLIEGEADGVDKISRSWAELNNIPFTPVEITNEDWHRYGSAAGNIRNQQMLDLALELAGKINGIVHGVAMWNGSSTGTQDMIQRMRKAGIHFDVHLLGKPKTKRLL